MPCRATPISVVVYYAILLAMTGCSSSSPGSGTDGGAGAGGQGASGATGASGTSGGAGTGAAGKDAGAPVPVTDAAGATSDATPPRYADGGVTAVAATPAATWTTVTGNLAGMASECGNTPYLVSHPASDMLITSVAKQGLWASSDGGTSWKQLWPQAGAMQITNRGSSIVFDPDHAETFWESGIYNGPGVYRTTDNGATFKALGDARHLDSVSVDLSDPLRLTLLAGGHEQKQTLFRSTDGGGTWTNVGLNLPAGSNFCTNALVIDKNVHLVGCSGYGGGTEGVFRTTDGGKTWMHPTDAPAASTPLWASDGTIYWALIYDRGLIKSTDQGNSWTQPIKTGVLKTVHPIELPDGRIVAAGGKTLMISSDKGETFKPLGPDLPFAPNTITYSPYRNAFYVEQFDCKNLVLPNAISRSGFDYRTQ